MSSESIARVLGEEVLDSRGDPTVQVTVLLENGSLARATVPSGSSTGEFEAVEVRDEDPARYRGRGVQRAVDHVNELISPALRGLVADDQWRIDQVLNELDPSEFKNTIGANATLGVSIACARVASQVCHLPLFQYLGGNEAMMLPVPMLNVINGGKHGSDGADIQEFMIVPYGAPTFREALRYGVEIYHVLRDLLLERGMSANVGDEGGFVPKLTSNEAGLELLLRAIERAGYRPGEDVGIALDFAASHLWKEGRYHFAQEKLVLTTEEIMALCKDWADRYPLVSIEDPLSDMDWEGYTQLTRELGGRLRIAGDDLFVSNRTFLLRGASRGCCNSVVIKPNQVGTVTDAMNTARLALSIGYSCIVAHRSGDSEDSSIADLAVALNCGLLKAGAPARGERVAKYNRLLSIETILGDRAKFAGRAMFTR